MSIAEPMAMELEQEAAGTRRILDCIPEDKFGWKPHDKSMTFGQLASHLAEALTWINPTLDMPEFVMDPEQYKPYQAADKAELLAAFDKNLAQAVAALKAASDETMIGTWRMVCAGEPKFEMPRVAVIRMMIMNHAIHHRAQLGVYLRLNDVPVPKTYGPTADFPEF